MAIDVDELKRRQRATWSAGDYPSIAELILSASERLVGELGIEPGMKVLDVATGTGNAAIIEAQKGGEVTGLDLTPELFDAARQRAADAGVEIEWIEGDAENLPFDDDSFDRVSSVFGAMFAPRHELAAAEITRVLKPGGRFAVTGWTPEGLNGRMLHQVSAHLPPPPGTQSPILWGSEHHLRELFADSGAELSFSHENVVFEFDSVADGFAHLEERLGPIIMAKAALAESGEWETLRAELVQLYENFNEATDGMLVAPAEYLLTQGTLPA